ncbi:MAG: hypothetical protein JWO69_1059 [Thermoleophilia bacterium]|jgi:hypothetical protein|nr:hypothetical protein [Thermoleophilia bacterium]
MSDSQRNLIILVAIAIAGVMFSGAFGIGAGGALAFLNLAFTVVIVWFLVTLYQRNSGTIATMPTGPRLMMRVACLALLLILVTGMLRLPLVELPSPFGWSNQQPVLFWGSVFACGFAIWYSWQQRTSRW